MRARVTPWSWRGGWTGWDSWGVRIALWRAELLFTLRHARGRRPGLRWRLRRGSIPDEPVREGADTWYAGVDDSRALDLSVMLHWHHRRPRASRIGPFHSRGWDAEGEEGIRA